MAGICDAVEVIAAMTGPDRRPGKRTIKRETGEGGRDRACKKGWSFRNGIQIKIKN